MVRARHLAAGAVAVGVCLSSLACVGGSKPPEGGAAGANAPKDIGSPLYAAAKMPELPPPAVRGEPIVVSNAVVQNDQRVQVPAQVDGLIELIASPLVKLDPADPRFDPRVHFDPKLLDEYRQDQLRAGTERRYPEIVFHHRDDPKERPYRRLRDNDTVRAGQILARLDETLVSVQIDANKVVMEASVKAIAAAKEAEDAQKQYLDSIKNLGLSKSEILNQLSLVARYMENRLQSEKEKAKSEGEMKSAEAQLSRYWVTSPMNGRVVRLLKSPLEYAKAGETIVEIQATDRVRVEGKIDVQYDRLVRRGMKVFVEPARPVGPTGGQSGHRQEVTGIAVTAHKAGPMIVTTGADASALVWDVLGTKQTHKLPHPAGVAVRSVAATGSSAADKPHFVATGADDGKVRLWDVTNPKQLPKEATVLEDAHGSAVTAAGFSPDGRFLATAAGRDVFVWGVADKKKLYALPQEHRDAVTSLRFTPQGTLVTASRDKSLRVWELGTAGGRTKSVIDHRGGAVDVLGVSADGSRVLFDKDASRLDVVSLADERTVATLQGAGGAARFGTLAVFSPTDKWVVTGGGDADQRGELTVWESPQPGGRGAERLRLMTPRGAAVTCAAFSPAADKPFVAAGTVDGGIFYWTPPAEGANQIVGEIVSVLPADAKTLQVRVEMANPVDEAGEGLKDRSLATIIINPDVQPVVPPAPPGGVRPAAAVGEPGGVVRAGGTTVPMATAPPASRPPVENPPAPVAPVPTAPPAKKQ